MPDASSPTSVARNVPNTMAGVACSAPFLGLLGRGWSVLPSPCWPGAAAGMVRPRGRRGCRRPSGLCWLALGRDPCRGRAAASREAMPQWVVFPLAHRHWASSGGWRSQSKMYRRMNTALRAAMRGCGLARRNPPTWLCQPGSRCTQCTQRQVQTWGNSEERQPSFISQSSSSFEYKPFLPGKARTQLNAQRAAVSSNIRPWQQAGRG